MAERGRTKGGGPSELSESLFPVSFLFVCFCVFSLVTLTPSFFISISVCVCMISTDALILSDLSFLFPYSLSLLSPPLILVSHPSCYIQISELRAGCGVGAGR